MAEKEQDPSERLIELETRLAFQDQTIEELHEALYRQQGQLDQMAREVAGLKRRLAAVLPEGETGGDACG